MKLECEYGGDGSLDSSCVDGSCWSYNHGGPTCPRKEEE